MKLQNKKIYTMSFIIEAIELLIKGQTQQTAKFLGFCNQNNQSRSLMGNQKINFLQKTLENGNQQLIQFWYNHKRIELVFLLNNLHRNLTYILNATININDFQLNFSFKPLNFTISNYLRVSSFQRRILAEKSIYMMSRLRPKHFNQLKMCVQLNMGVIKIETPFYYNTIKDIFQLPKKLKSFIGMFQNNIPKLYESLLILIEFTNQSPHKYAQELVLKTGDKLKDMQRYLKLSNVVVNIGAEEVSQYQCFTNQSFNQQQSLTQINRNIIQKEDQFSSHWLYYSSKQEIYGNINKKLKKEQYLLLDEKKRETIRGNLQISQISIMQQSNQRKFIVNQIKLVKPLNQLELLKKYSGGFSEIYQAEVLYKAQDNAPRPGNQEVNKKIMMIKCGHANALSKIKLQKEILLKLKNAFAIFLPRYYFPPKQEATENLLFVQKVSGQLGTHNLEEFAILFKNTISLHTKMYIGFSILQGLRFLKDYQIVHLDLKPSNIMIGKKMDLKLIDFGQAYHPSFTNHYPGRTMPYSSPENYYKTSDFNFKSDVFSFGVIMHNLVTAKHPFYVYSQKQRQKAFLSIQNRWFFNPQGLSQYGQTIVLPYIFQLIGKCLNQDPKCRPQLQWITLIFRQYLYFH